MKLMSEFWSVNAHLKFINNMEIQDIKAKLTLSDVIKHYGLKADKQKQD